MQQWICVLHGVAINCLCTENKGVGVMKPGHSFTIEPMINEGLFFFQHSLITALMIVITVDSSLYCKARERRPELLTATDSH